MRSDGYAEVSTTLLLKAREELHKGDAIQASEKLWGAAAQMVKAVAERRGWDHHDHRALFRVARLLADETGDPELRRLFQVADSLHANFYEHWQELEFVAAAAPDIEELVRKMEQL